MHLFAILDSRFGSYARILLIFLASRLMLTVIGLLALVSFGDQSTQVHWFNWENIANLYARWDSNWYLSIIENGYSRIEVAEQSGATNFAFFRSIPC